MDSKVIMYDDPAAAQPKTIDVWVSLDGRYFMKESSARYASCTHQTCECGGVMKKGWTKCDTCRNRAEAERYANKPFLTWDGKTPICLYNDDKYFFSEDDLIEYLDENNLNGSDVKLMLCTPFEYNAVDWETIATDVHDEWEPTKEMEQKLDEFNAYLKGLPAHSWGQGAFRTTYDYEPTEGKKEGGL